MDNTNKDIKRPKAHKRPDAAAIRGLLFEANFGQSNADDALPVSDPISITQMVLKLSEIKAYDKNPRQLINPEYSSIKASIRNQRSLNNPFNVTRRPGAEHYMVQSGGNTRLAILRELYAETGDEAFNTVHCLFVPWTNESAVITAHLVENEMRGEMALIDKAYGIQALRSQLEQEQGSALSDKAFIKIVIELGYKLSIRQASRLNYALELDQIIPQALREGVTHRQLDTIKNTEKAYLRYCEGKTEQMPELFARNMTEHDSDAFDFERVRNAIEHELGELIDVPSNRLSLQIDVLMVEDSKKQNKTELLIESIEEYPDEYADSREPIRGQNEENHDAEQHNVRLVLVDEPEQQQTQTPNKPHSSPKQLSSVKAVEPPKRVIEETPIKLDLPLSPDEPCKPVRNV